MDFTEQDVLQFFDRNLAAWPLYQAFERELFARLPDTKRKVQKTQIAFSNRYLFVCVSFLRVKKKAELPDPYFVLTLGEVLFSATGLEFAFSQAPAAMRSTITSLWNLTTTVGNFLVVLVVALARDLSAAERFYFFAALMAAVAVVFGVFSFFYKYKDGNA